MTQAPRPARARFRIAPLVAAGLVWPAGCTSTGATGEAPEAGAETTGWFSRRPPPARVDRLDPTRYETPKPSETSSEISGEQRAGDNADDGSARARNSANWRPSWWHDDVQRTHAQVHVCAMAEGLDLAGARSRALELARASLANQEPGGSGKPAGRGPETLVDSIRLPDGRYRAFVRLTVRRS